MKKFLTIIFLTLFASLAYSQSVDINSLTKDENELSYLENKLYSGKVFAKHSNGKLGLVGEYKDGKKEGTWTYWYSSGEKKRESNYINNKKEGITYYWHLNGQIAKEITYRNDKNIDQKLWDDKGNRLKNPAFESFK